MILNLKKLKIKLDKIKIKKNKNSPNEFILLSNFI